MYVKDRMNKNVVSVQENISIAKTLILMNESRHKRLVVVDADQKPVGIIDRQSIESLGTAKFLLANTKISDVMEASFFKADENMLVEDCALIMKDNKAGFLPVVNSANILTGVITSYDMLKGLMKLMDIRGEGCRCILAGRNIKKAAEVLKDLDILSIYTDNENTVVKFYTPNAKEAKELLESNFEVLYFKEI